MTMRRVRPGEHRLTVTIQESADGDGFDVDAICPCSWPNMTSGHGWVWQGWCRHPAGAADLAASEWDRHRADVERRFGHLLAGLPW